MPKEVGKKDDNLGHWHDAWVLSGWVVITFGALFSMLGALPSPVQEDASTSSKGWWIFTHEWMLQLFSGTVGALMGAVVAAIAAVVVLNGTNAKQQSLWDASKVQDEIRTSKARQVQSAADLTEALLKLIPATYRKDENDVVEASYASTNAFVRWSSDLFGLNEDFRKELSRWNSGFHRDSRALHKLRQHQPHELYKSELDSLQAVFSMNIEKFIRTYSRWLAQEEVREEMIQTLRDGKSGDIALRIHGELGIPQPWLLPQTDQSSEARL
ncbi:UNVERIFIED_ORG: hypothetical protein ABID57_002156 [Arthrobacter sp. UYEF1]